MSRYIRKYVTPPVTISSLMFDGMGGSMVEIMDADGDAVCEVHQTWWNSREDVVDLANDIANLINQHLRGTENE